MKLVASPFEIRNREGRTLVRSRDFDLKHGSIEILVGPNGAGKTLFLNYLAQVLPTSLKVVNTTLPSVEGRSGESFHREVRFLSSRMTAMIPNDPVRRVFHLFSYGAPIEELSDSDLTTLCRRRWFELSQGQKNRVLFEAALASRPQFLLLDEILSPMDFHHEWTSFLRLRTEATSLRMGVLIAHHDLALPEAGEFSRYHWMNQGELRTCTDAADFFKTVSEAYPLVPYFNKFDRLKSRP